MQMKAFIFNKTRCCAKIAFRLLFPIPAKWVLFDPPSLETLPTAEYRDNNRREETNETQAISVINDAEWKKRYELVGTTSSRVKRLASLPRDCHECSRLSHALLEVHLLLVIGFLLSL